MHVSLCACVDMVWGVHMISVGWLVLLSFSPGCALWMLRLRDPEHRLGMRVVPRQRRAVAVRQHPLLQVCQVC